MLFNSISFVFFFLIVTSLYFLLPHKYRWFLLLVASCIFYMAFVPIYILILGFTIVIDYYAGIYIENAIGARRKLLLTVSLVANIGILAVFKYYNFISENLTNLLQALGLDISVPLLTILLPIGLSFHTFQAMSYTIEVYRGNQKAVKEFGIYSLYVMFYPQLVAGPIERPQNLLYQFYEKHNFDYFRVKEGLKRMLWGLFKKLVVADRLSLYVDAVYNNIGHHSSSTLIVATIFFAIQIYCDFSGYADIALGSAQVMGFTLMENFKRPYFSKTISEFWSRWHISLSTWFKDYLYISLGGNRVSVPRWYLNLFIVFVVSGLWHGANWTYIIWGALNGIYLVAAIILAKPKAAFNNWIGITGFPRIYLFVQIVTTFILICFTWIFFRANSISDAFKIIGRISRFEGSLYKNETMFYGLMAIGILFISEFVPEYFPQYKLALRSENAAIRIGSYALIILLILSIGVFDGGQFIYFQF
ncbi:MBOAT family protein [Dyadobacter flavalbus]|uniref:MBOAT family protein n=1 Tax=Dyadobacter flavalbus TaxID=2579942 RepID=A0A5M8QV30_9BACT|nr:MBOAT family protein [Dyadobacter flavalbus]